MLARGWEGERPREPKHQVINGPNVMRRRGDTPPYPRVMGRARCPHRAALGRAISCVSCVSWCVPASPNSQLDGKPPRRDETQRGELATQKAD